MEEFFSGSPSVPSAGFPQMDAEPPNGSEHPVVPINWAIIKIWRNVPKWTLTQECMAFAFSPDQ